MFSKTLLLAVLWTSLAMILDSVKAGTPWIPQERRETLTKHQQLLNQTHHYKEKIHAIFLGASIVEYWQQNGKKLWEKHYQPRQAFNYGVAGDRTEHVLWRIDHGEFDGVSNCRVIVLEIGGNNIGSNSHNDIAKGVEAVLKKLEAKMPRSKILLLALFPRGGSKNQDVHKINDLIKKLQDNRKIFYLDLTKYYEHDQKIISDLYVSDQLHLSEKGYEIWYEKMEPEFAKLLKSQ